jgi:hypothetical protein
VVDAEDGVAVVPSLAQPAGRSSRTASRRTGHLVHRRRTDATSRPY